MYKDYGAHKRASLDLETAMRFLMEGQEKGLKAIEVTGGGEPTSYYAFSSFMEFVKHRFEFAVVTNGSNLHKDEVREAMRTAEWVRISIDAARPETYAQIHGVEKPSLLEVLKGAQRFHEESPETVLGFSFVVCLENYQEIQPAVRVAKDYGFSNIRFSAYYQYPKGRCPLEELEDEIQLRFDLALNESTELFKVFAFRERISEVYHGARCKRCYYSLLTSVIAASGDCYSCCALKNEPRAKTGNYEVSWDDVYKHRRMVFTKDCPRCWMDKKNELADYFLHVNPQHVNFI